MTTLQLSFLIVLTGSMLVVVGAAAGTIHAAVKRRAGDQTGSWLSRLAVAARPRDQMWAYVLHRLSGVAILAFLIVHIADVSVLALSRDGFDEIHDLYGTAPMRAFECLLLFAILFHTLNGLRLFALDISDLGEAASRRMLRAILAGTLVLGSAASAMILAPIW
jgi:succinate dehydrogenase cytochrome b subunit